LAAKMSAKTAVLPTGEVYQMVHRTPTRRQSFRTRTGKAQAVVAPFGRRT
jgi:hypothetical protein